MIAGFSWCEMTGLRPHHHYSGLSTSYGASFDVASPSLGFIDVSVGYSVPYCWLLLSRVPPSSAPRFFRGFMASGWLVESWCELNAFTTRDGRPRYHISPMVWLSTIPLTFKPSPSSRDRSHSQALWLVPRDVNESDVLVVISYLVSNTQKLPKMLNFISSK